MTIGNNELAKRIGATTADATGVKPRRMILDLRTDEIEPDPDQPRKDFDEESLVRLAESLRKDGQLQPVLVRKEGSRYILVAGERRWRAAKLAGMSTVQAISWRGGDPLTIQLVENLLREDLKPVERARAYYAIIQKEGWKVRELARHLSLEHSGISKSLALLGLSKEIQDLIDAGDIPPTTAYEISMRPPAERAKLAKDAAEGRIKGDDIRKLKPKPAAKPSPVPAAKPSPAPAPAAVPALTLGGRPRENSWIHATGMVQVVVSGHREPRDIVNALEKALTAARAGKKSLEGGVGRR